MLREQLYSQAGHRNKSFPSAICKWNVILLSVIFAGLALGQAGCGKSDNNDKSISEATKRLIEEAKHEKPPAGKHYHEAPMLAELVKAGKLPPVWKRLPENPVIVPVYEEIGQYGGTWHRMMNGTSDIHAHTRINYENILRWAPDPKDAVILNLAEEYEFEDNFKVVRFRLRKGLKWSDGYPFTTDDIVFWWQRIANDRNITAVVPKDWCPGGKPMVLKQIDKHTIELHFAKPYPIAEKLLAFKAGQWPLGFERYGLFVPKHYLEQFHPACNPKVEGYDLFERKACDFNPERPVMTPWQVTIMDEGMRMVAERNPYYWKVDKEGNQLPYIDGVVHEFFFSPEMLNFRALTGEIDMQIRHFSLDNYSLLLDFAKKRGYRVIRYNASGTGALAVNPEYRDPANPDNEIIREYFQKKDFRRALSLAIDRDLIREIVGKNVIGPATYNMATFSRYYAEIDEKEISKYLRYDLDEANRLLDKVGLNKRDEDGFRVMKNGETMSIIIEISGSRPSGTVEIICAGWNKVGIKTTVIPHDRTLQDMRIRAGLPMALSCEIHMAWPISADCQRFGIGKGGGWCWAYGLWYRTNGKQGIEPPAEVKRIQRIFELIKTTNDVNKQKKLMAELVRIHADSVWYISVNGSASFIGVVKDNFRNVPLKAFGSWVVYTPANQNPEQFFFKKTKD
jgi:peptide/nickel transport system substrate-binding protein